MGQQAFNIISKNHVVIPAQVYEAMIRFYIAAKEVGQAERILLHMKHTGDKPSNAIYTQLIEVCLPSIAVGRCCVSRLLTQEQAFRAVGNHATASRLVKERR